MKCWVRDELQHELEAFRALLEFFLLEHAFVLFIRRYIYFEIFIFSFQTHLPFSVEESGTA